MSIDPAGHAGKAQQYGQMFALRFIRLLCKSRAGDEIGVEGCWLLTTIVLVQDEIRFARPAKFFNDPLCEKSGLLSEGRLIAARKKCIEAGWLLYKPGAKRCQGSYAVQVPDRYRELMRAPGTADDAEEYASKIEVNPTMPANTHQELKRIPNESQANPLPYNPIPIPIHTNQPTNQTGGARPEPVGASDSCNGGLAGWEPGISILKRGGVLIAKTLAREAREVGRDPVEWAALARSAVMTAAANGDKLTDRAGAIVSFLRRGVWPLPEIVSPEEAAQREAKRDARQASDRAMVAEYNRMRILKEIVRQGTREHAERRIIRDRLLSAGLSADWLEDHGWGEPKT